MWTLDVGGAEKVTLDLVRSSRELGAHFRVICFGGRAGALAEDFRLEGCDTSVLDLKAQPVSSLKHFWGDLRFNRPDCVVLNIGLPSSLLAFLAAASGVRNIVIRQHSDGDGKSDSWPRVVYRHVLRLLIGLAPYSRVVAVSPAALEFASLRPDGGRGGIVLPNFVDTDRFAPSLDALPSDIDVLYVGRGGEAKRRWLLAPIAKALSEKGIGPIVVCGEPGEDIQPSENLELLGRRDDIPDLLRRAKCLVLVSRREGLPGVVLEALACGVPVVASATTGAEYIASHTPGVHLLGLDATSDQWSEAIEAVIQHSDSERRFDVSAGLRSSIFAPTSVIVRWRALIERSICADG